MSGVALDIATFFSTAAGGSLGSVTGTITLFENMLPASPDVCGAVFQTGGPGPDRGFGVAGIQHERPMVQVRFRGAPDDADGPRVKAETAYRKLCEAWPVTLSGTLYLELKPMGHPIILERDANRRVVWSFNVLILKELTAAP